MLSRDKIVLACLILFSGLARAEDFKACVFMDADGRSMPYRLCVPRDYDAEKKYPVILFFHGSGERGSDNAVQVKNGVQNFALPAVQKKYPAIIIVPQCPADQWWVNTDFHAPSSTRPALPSDAMHLALEILDRVSTEFSVDKARVYVMGPSLGGYAVWDCITRYPDRFAAGVAVCGGGDETTVTPEVAKVPMWAMASSDDPNVPPLRSVHMIEAMMAAGGHPRLSLYSGLGHVSWDKAFAEPELVPWVFSQHLAGAPAADAK